MPADYVLAMSELLEKNSNERFLLESRKHDLLFLDLIFNKIKREDPVLCYIEKIEDLILDNKLNNWLKISKDLKLIVDSYNGVKDYLNILSHSEKEKIKINLVKNIKNNHKKHFCIFGNYSYLYETDMPKVFLANFNSKKDVEKLEKRFFDLIVV